jgi:exopolysaccharide biosynthesis WecB/TagA/CpsF family protein
VARQGFVDDGRIADSGVVPLHDPRGHERPRSFFRLAAPEPPSPSLDVLGVLVSNASASEVCAWVLAAVRARGRDPRVVSFAGARALLAAYRDPDRRRLLARADLVLGEGSGLAAYGALAGYRRPARSDAVATLAHLFSCADPAKPLRVFLYGGVAGRAREAAARIARAFPNVRIAGAADLRRRTSLVEEINEACADVLVVGLGDRTDEWIEENVALLDVGVVLGGDDVIDALAASGSHPRRGGPRAAPRASVASGPIAAIAFLWCAVLYLVFGVRPRALPW